jgi:hypothetical protein
MGVRLASESTTGISPQSLSIIICPTSSNVVSGVQQAGFSVITSLTVFTVHSFNTRRNGAVHFNYSLFLKRGNSRTSSRHYVRSSSQWSRALNLEVIAGVEKQTNVERRVEGLASIRRL